MEIAIKPMFSQEAQGESDSDDSHCPRESDISSISESSEDGDTK